MQILKRVFPLVAVLALALVVAACGDAASQDPTSGTGSESDSGFGEPADPGDAVRTVEVVAADDLTFDPAEISVSAGEVVTFRMVNNGQMPHDFTIGDEATQNEHEELMAESGGAHTHEVSNAILVAAGETKELTWRFADEGTVIFGCHQPGHYSAGMRGEITVGS